MSYEDKIKDQARPYLQPDERILAAFIARPRGATQASMGGLAGKVVTVTVAGTPVKLEVGGGDAKGLANQFAQVKTSV